MRNNLYALLFLTATTLSPWFSDAARACTIFEEMVTHLPFNTTDISNADRLVIASKFIEAKKWPDVQIQAVVIAGAYKGEHNIERLKEVRGENIKAYLQMLGIKSDNILIDKKTFTDEMVEKLPDGTLNVNQIVVEMTPLCKGSCARLCDDPRVTPHTKLIN